MPPPDWKNLQRALGLAARHHLEDAGDDFVHRDAIGLGIEGGHDAVAHDRACQGFDVINGDMEAAPALAGQSAGLIDSVKTAKDIIEDTVAEFFEISARMGAKAQSQSF